MPLDRDHALDGPEPAPQAVSRVHGGVRQRFGRRYGEPPGPPVLAGLLLVFVGALFLLDNLNLIEARGIVRSYWPVVLVAWGLSRVLQGGDRVIGPFAVVLGVVLLGNRLLHWGISVAALFWPIVLIAVGTHILLRHWRNPVHVLAAGPADLDADARPDGGIEDARVDASPAIREVAFMASVERRNVSQTFRGGSASATMGSIELDLRECRMNDGETRLDLSAFMGQVTLRIPRDWTVDSRVDAILASVEDRSEPPVQDAKRLVLRGSAILGSIEIRN